MAPPSKTKMSGKEILRRFMRRNEPPTYVGREGALTGAAFRKDLSTDGWLRWQYEVKFQTEHPGRNWFAVGDFVDAVLED